MHRLGPKMTKMALAGTPNVHVCTCSMYIYTKVPSTEMNGDLDDDTIVRYSMYHAYI